MSEEGGGQEYTVAQQQSYLDSNVVALQLDSATIIEDLEHYLRAEVFSPREGKWVAKPGATALMNDEGINTLIQVLRIHVDKNFALTNFTEQQIFKIIMQPLEIDLIWNIRHNWNRFGITNKANADLILNSLTNAAFASVMRSKDGMTLNMFTNTQRINQSFVPQQKRRTILGGLLKNN